MQPSIMAESNVIETAVEASGRNLMPDRVFGAAGVGVGIISLCTNTKLLLYNGVTSGFICLV